MDVGEIGLSVLSTTEWRLRHTGGRALPTDIAVPVHRGWWVARETWDAWRVEARVAARTIAVLRSAQGGDPVASHTSAAALWGLPLLRYDPLRVHITSPRANGVTRGSQVARHAADLSGARAELCGLPVTSLARTVADVIGRLPLVTAVALADAALRTQAQPDFPAIYDRDAAARFTAEVQGCPALQPGSAHGVRARWVLAFADGRAQLPGESLSRLFLHQLGFAPPRLQVRVPHDTGFYDIDFGMDDVDAWGEFDGMGKYTEPRMLAGRTTAEVLLAEKAREDDIRGRTGRRVVRWGWPHLASLEAFHHRLRAFRIASPGHPPRIPPSALPRL